MKRYLAILLLLAFSLSMLTACNDSSDASSSPVSDTESKTEETPMVPDKNAKTVWDELYADKTGGFDSAESVGKLTAYSDGKVTDKYDSLPAGDTRYLFEGKDNTRVAVLSEGYALTLPGKNVEADFSLGALRSKYKTDKYVLTVSYENRNTYGKDPNTGTVSKDGFDIYFREWLIRYLDADASDKDVLQFFAENKMSFGRPASVNTDHLKGYTINYYHVKFRVATKMEYDNYSIAVVRPTNSYNYFWLFVLKSKGEMYDEAENIVKSFKELEKKGTPVNSVGSYELRIPDYWSKETRAYYDKILNQTTVDWGAFFHQNTEEYIDWFTSEEGINTDMDVFMTYLHIGWYDQRNYLDMDMINREAGGNGFNGKPVLNLTYQFTTTNNNLDAAYTPMFDICRGTYDTHFRRLAQDIKSYGKPVLFRLNNEMNTDWTNYCGMQTMLDPDVFIATWQRLYNIFREEGVDNTIWIFNPFDNTFPYCNWGDMLNYFPGEDYVQMLGLTAYQDNNDGQIESFKQMYSDLYSKNSPYFDNYPAIIGEFACGAGGEVIYSWDQGAYVPIDNLDQKRQWQADWIKGMFECMINNQAPENKFCKNIKIAIWFSANDFVEVNGENKIKNYFKLDEGVPLAIQAFREGYAALRDERESTPENE